jgi:NTE family protein
MSRKRVAIACQGGGSQCAFIAGALKALFDEEVQHRYQIVGLSGTSGGAFTAALAWLGLLREARGEPASIGEGSINCWRDLTAQTSQEVLLDRLCVDTLRMVERGLLPSVARSPSSLQFRLWSEATARFISRPQFTDLRALLEKHLDFKTVARLVDADSPVLLVGAADIVEGSFKVFSSARGEVKLESLLASAAIPNLFPAVHVDGHVFWDGIFATNPPVISFLRRRLMGAAPLPDEVWVIQVNRSRHQSVPELPSDIFDRRNHLAGNLSLQHELQLIEMINLLLQEGALTDRFRTSFGLDTTESIQVRFIRISQELQEGLDYPSKLSRQPGHIARLLADGEAQARIFLEALRESHDLPDIVGVEEARGAGAGARQERPS